MPRPESVIAEKPFTPRGAAGPEAAPAPAAPPYRILQTTEVDEYEEGRALRVPEAAGDDFGGTARRATKLSIADGTARRFNDLQDLIDSLPSDQSMIDHRPPIRDTATSRRVAEEQRNVRVDAFLYAASRENDNDYHLIIGRDPEAGGDEVYMTIEVSGLPPRSNGSFARLNSARNAYKQFFDGDLPGTRYQFYDPPIPVRVTGSIFFDITHARGGRPGPQSLRPNMPTIWEIHPVSRIEFEP
jgi:hypothetical protein